VKNKSFSPGIIALIAASTIWGSTFVITKSLMNSISPFVVVNLRLVVSIIALTPFALKRGFRLKMIFQKVYLLYGLTGIALYYGPATIGLSLSTSANAALIQAVIPAVVALLSVIFLKEKISGQRYVGIGLSIFGILLVSGFPSGAGKSTLIGNLLILGSVVSWSIYNIQSRNIPVDVDPIVSTTASFYAGTLLLLPFAGWEIAMGGLPHITQSAWSALIYLGVFASALAYFLWNLGLNRMDASLAAPFINLIPIVGLTCSILTGETVSIVQITGGLIAIIGVLITQNLLNFKRGVLDENPGSTN
jgi:drug/metabolite transporter (DMT)-like permease